MSNAKCEAHPEITAALGSISSTLNIVKDVSNKNNDSLNELKEGYINNRNLIDNLTAEMKNGLSTKVSNIESNLTELRDCLVKERIERHASVEGWLRRSFQKALNNLGVIIAAVLIWKIITWIATIPTVHEFMKKLAGL